MQEESAEETVVTVGMESESMRMESQTVTAETQVTAAGGAAARMMSDMEETMARPPGKTDSPSKRKGNKLMIPLGVSESKPRRQMIFSWVNPREKQIQRS